MNKLYFFLLFVLVFAAGQARAQDVSEKNKTLFNATVDKVNFRTIEFVYDRKFPRKKFPASLTDIKSRKAFDDFDGDARFKKLFLNYNDVAEKFKKKYGNGKTDLASFEKGLSDILINKDFEFFISSLNKDDKIQLIKSLQQINKKGIAQFVDAAGKPRGFFASDSVINESADPIAKPGKSNSNTTVASTEDSSEAVINTEATPEEVFQEKTPRRDWLTWVSLLCSLGALVLAASIKFKDVPGLRSFMANNYQKRGESNIAVIKPQGKAEPVTTATADPALVKKLDNLTREVEGLYAQMDELLHKNSVLEQKLAEKHPKPFDLPKTAYFEPETEPETLKMPAAPAAPKSENQPAKPEFVAETAPIAPVRTEEKAPQIQPSYKSFDLTEEDYVQDDFIDETEDLQEITFFLAKPDKQGFFWNEEMRRSFIPHQSFYEITLAQNDSRKATFNFVRDAIQQKLAIENPELYLYPVCEVTGEGTKIETIAPGKLVLNADQWVLVKKATIRLS